MTERTLETIQVSTGERLANEIRRLIYEGEIAPGDRLIEEDLASRFGVSRGPVREAIRVLAASGTAVLRRNRGASVVEPTLADVLEVYAIRRSLGSFAIAYGSAEGVIDSERKTELEARLEELNSLEIRGSQLRMAQRDLDFQTDLIAATGLTRAAEAFRSTAQDIRLFVRAFNIPYDPRGHADIMARHQRLLDTMAAGDGESAQEQWLEHVRRNTQEFASYLPAEQQNSAIDSLRTYLMS